MPKSIEIESFSRSELPEYARNIVATFEDRFQRPISSVTEISAKTLQELHRPSTSGLTLNNPEGIEIEIVSSVVPKAKTLIEEMGKIANSPNLKQQDHVRFKNIVIKIYQLFTEKLNPLVNSKDTLVIAPLREGHWIASTMGWMHEGRSCAPNAKRMFCNNNILVGLNLDLPDGNFQKCVIVDGAIASGSTLITIMEAVKPHISEFHIFSAHAAVESLRALANYAQMNNLNISITVGHVSGNLNKKLYATAPSGELVIGDLGDIMAPAF